jgi:hypothetical protein
MVDKAFKDCDCQKAEKEGFCSACQLYMHKEHFVLPSLLKEHGIDFIEVSSLIQRLH